MKYPRAPNKHYLLHMETGEEKGEPLHAKCWVGVSCKLLLFAYVGRSRSSWVLNECPALWGLISKPPGQDAEKAIRRKRRWRAEEDLPSCRAWVLSCHADGPCLCFAGHGFQVPLHAVCPGLWLLRPGTALPQCSAAEADKSYLKSCCICLGWRLGGVALCCGKSRFKTVCLMYLELNLKWILHAAMSRDLWRSLVGTPVLLCYSYSCSATPHHVQNIAAERAVWFGSCWEGPAYSWKQAGEPSGRAGKACEDKGALLAVSSWVAVLGAQWELVTCSGVSVWRCPYNWKVPTQHGGKSRGFGLEWVGFCYALERLCWLMRWHESGCILGNEYFLFTLWIDLFQLLCCELWQLWWSYGDSLKLLSFDTTVQAVSFLL